MLRSVRVRPSSSLGITAIFLAAFVACSDADGTVKGGDLTESGRGAVNPPDFQPREGGSECVGSGSKWSDLYRDIFGPTGRPGSCSFRGGCHESSASAGAIIPSGIECFDEKGCRQSILDQELVSNTPEESRLFTGVLRLRKPDGTLIGSMPLLPADYVFPETCLERIRTWIRDGAKDD